MAEKAVGLILMGSAAPEWAPGEGQTAAVGMELSPSDDLQCGVRGRSESTASSSLLPALQPRPAQHTHCTLQAHRVLSNVL